MMGVFIRGGSVVNVERGNDWKKTGTVEPLKDFVQYLPDMDFVSNQHDECRVIKPHEYLERYLHIALTQTAKASAKSSPRNVWSRPQDLNSGFIERKSRSPLNEYAHQHTWAVSRLACHKDSPARAFSVKDEIMPDATDAYSFGDLGIVSNRTAFTNICVSPSLRETWGFFNRPNALSVSHELLPIFSASKLSTFQDILFPAPWYLSNQVKYDESVDPTWENKKEVLHWRGTDTSGFSRTGSWHRQHRQIFVERVERPGTAKILWYSNVTGWSPKEVPREDYRDVLMSTSFYSTNVIPVTATKSGNTSTCGRFYTFLESKSLTFKLSMFREWHEERVKPWVHYVPLSVRGTEHLEALKYFAQEAEGKAEARRIEEDSTAWARTALRRVDMQAYLFRLLLEYGRLVDDDRDEIGF